MRFAFFDLDHTLLPLDSDYEWGEYTQRIGWVDSVGFKARNDAFYAEYQAGSLDVREYVRFATEAARRQGQKNAELARSQFLAEVIRPSIRPAAISLLETHRTAGDVCVIVTATNEFVTAPIAEMLGVEHLIAVKLCRDEEGWITGEIDGVPSFRSGKVSRVESWLADQGLELRSVDSVFYSDSLNDLPLLEFVREPVATNADPRLRALALERGWRVLDLFGETL